MISSSAIGKILASVAAAVLSLNTAQTESPADMHDTVTIDGKSYVLSFEDEFDGDEIDSSKWDRPSMKRQDLNDYWDPSMSYTDGNGNLVIETSYDSERDRFLSGAVRSRGRFEQAYGYYEIRCTLNNVSEYWFAFWLYNDCVGKENLGGVNGTEIDIFESAMRDEGIVQQTLNWDGYGAKHKSLANRVKKNVYDGEYHTFALLWTEKEYVFYVDGEETWRTTAAIAKGVCREPLYLKISAETGSWTGTPSPDSLPDRIYVDYVRVYKSAE